MLVTLSVVGSTGGENGFWLKMYSGWWKEQAANMLRWNDSLTIGKEWHVMLFGERQVKCVNTIKQQFKDVGFLKYLKLDVFPFLPNLHGDFNKSQWIVDSVSQLITAINMAKLHQMTVGVSRERFYVVGGIFTPGPVCHLM